MKKDSDGSPNTSKNTSDPLRDYSVRELQEIADRVLAGAFPDGLSIPIEVESIAYHLGLDINPIPGLCQVRDVLGAVWLDTAGRYWVVVDEHLMDRYEGRYRFTVAEEVAHFIIHRPYIDQARDIQGAIVLQGRLTAAYRYVEANARRLAAELLMPRELLKRDAAAAYAKVIDVVGYRNIEAVKKQVTDILRRQYVVSEQAMRYQLGSHCLRAYEAIDKAFRAHSKSLWEER
ncbi:MAG: ImmA/IrrE family metallo-endopeptidase [Planctomycetes bacterium]|nr:ImmA/IrrE family metallo-endopeptidase [Planctomycetota bacterium]